MNFNQFMPGKMIGLNLHIGNRSNCEQIIELSVDETQYMYPKEALMQKFPETREVSSST